MLGHTVSTGHRNIAIRIEQFRAAVRLRPDYGTARYNLARALTRAFKFDEAIEDYDQLLKQFPRDAQVRDELGELYLRQGKRAQAFELLAPVYNWFTEGFDTADLQEAKALLEALA